MKKQIAGAIQAYIKVCKGGYLYISINIEEVGTPENLMVKNKE